MMDEYFWVSFLKLWGIFMGGEAQRACIRTVRRNNKTSWRFLKSELHVCTLSQVADIMDWIVKHCLFFSFFPVSFWLHKPSAWVKLSPWSVKFKGLRAHFVWKPKALPTLDIDEFFLMKDGRLFPGRSARTRKNSQLTPCVLFGEKYTNSLATNWWLLWNILELPFSWDDVPVSVLLGRWVDQPPVIPRQRLEKHWNWPKDITAAWHRPCGAGKGAQQGPS